MVSGGKLFLWERDWEWVSECVCEWSLCTLAWSPLLLRLCCSSAFLSCLCLLLSFSLPPPPPPPPPPPSLSLSFCVGTRSGTGKLKTKKKQKNTPLLGKLFKKLIYHCFISRLSLTLSTIYTPLANSCLQTFRWEKDWRQEGCCWCGEREDSEKLETKETG